MSFPEPILVWARKPPKWVAGLLAGFGGDPGRMPPLHSHPLRCWTHDTNLISSFETTPFAAHSPPLPGHTSQPTLPCSLPGDPYTPAHSSEPQGLHFPRPQGAFLPTLVSQRVHTLMLTHGRPGAPRPVCDHTSQPFVSAQHPPLACRVPAGRQWRRTDVPHVRRSVIGSSAQAGDGASLGAGAEGGFVP